MIPPEALGWSYIVFMLAAIAYAALRYVRSDGRGKYDFEERVGAVGPLEVGIAFDGSRRFVELNIPHEGEDLTLEIHAYLTATQAKLLAEWLRVASAPGRTLNEARRRSRKAIA